MSEKIIIVVPAFNEEKNIGRVIGGLFENGFRRIVVVDDGSTDKTGEIASGLGVTVLRHEINRGQGAALQTGNEFALAQGAEIVVHFDADWQFNPADVNLAIEAMETSRADVVLGSRFLDARSRLPWTKKNIIYPLARLVSRLFAGIKLTDAQNGFRVFSRRALEKLRIVQDGMAHNTEIISQIRRHNFKFIEHPVQVIYREYGLGIGGGIRIVWDMLKFKVL